MKNTLTTLLELSYSGRLSNVPKTVTAISKLIAAKLREILHFHGYPITSTKDQLALRVYLLKHRQTAAVTFREEQIKDVFCLLILAQKKLLISSHKYKNGHTLPSHVISGCHHLTISPYQMCKICFNL